MLLFLRIRPLSVVYLSRVLSNYAERAFCKICSLSVFLKFVFDFERLASRAQYKTPGSAGVAEAV